MDTKLMITKTDTALTTLWEPKNIAPAKAGEVICSFLDTATVSMGRATHYNTREEQQTAELKAHEALLGMSRDVYAVLLALRVSREESSRLITEALMVVKTAPLLYAGHPEDRLLGAEIWTVANTLLAGQIVTSGLKVPYISLCAAGA